MDNLLDALADENKKRQLSYRLQQLKDSLNLGAAGYRLPVSVFLPVYLN